MLTNVSLLTDPPGQMARHPHTGANYYEGADIIAHLSRCFGPAGWSWTTGEHGFDELADEVYVVGTLTARIVEAGPDGDERTIETHHTERGWKAVSRRRDNGNFVSLGDDYKGADTDALKRAARLLGVGLDAWSKAQPSSPSRRSAPPSPSPTEQTRADQLVKVDPQSLSKTARADLETVYRDLLVRAFALDFRASWTSEDPARWSDVQLSKYHDLLHAYISRQEGAA